MVRIKFCGMTSARDARAAVQAGADAVGVVLARSPRRVTPAQATEIVEAVGPLVPVIGVLVNPTVESVKRLLARCPLNAIQLHGDESPALVKRIARLAPVIKTVRLTRPEDVRRAVAYLDAGARIRGLLCDSAVRGMWGGSGVPSDWRLAEALRRRMSSSGSTRHRASSLVLAGGLTPDNVEEAIRRVRPYGVDVSSGVERSPGSKSPDRMRAFVEAVRRATSARSKRRTAA